MCSPCTCRKWAAKPPTRSCCWRRRTGSLSESHSHDRVSASSCHLHSALHAQLRLRHQMRPACTYVDPDVDDAHEFTALACCYFVRDSVGDSVHMYDNERALWVPVAADSGATCSRVGLIHHRPSFTRIELDKSRAQSALHRKTGRS
jgi:hypothetical protein